jgi:hypothetical protein
MEVRMRYLMITLGIAVALHVTPAHAQFGKLLKEGLEAVGKKAFSGSSKAAQESAETLLKKGATTAARKVGREAAESVAKQTAKQATGIAVRNSDAAAKVITKHGAAIAAPLLSRFGDDGAKALSKLSTTNARRMAMLTEELGAGGRGADFMRVLAERGDVAAEWIWKNKGTIAVGTTAVAFLTNPDAFLQAGEGLVTKSVETAGKHVAEPLIKETAKTVAPVVGK